MINNDPWDWANQSSQSAQQPLVAAPLSNTIVPLQANNEQMQPGQVIQEKPNRDAEQLRSMAINKGVEKGGNYAYGAYKDMTAGPIGTGGAPVVEQSVMASYPTVAAPTSTMAGIGTGAAGSAATTAAQTAAMSEATALAGGSAAAGEAGMLASMGPVGWGIGALMLAKSMKWI